MRQPGPHRRAPFRTFATILITALALASGASDAWGQAELSATERAIAERVDQGVDDAIALIEETVNINSGTLNLAGVRAVHDALAPELEALGFEVRWEPLPPETGRAGHLVAERVGTRGQRLLLIGHLDTVFEPDSPFQQFVREGDMAYGPGVVDMKAGNVVILLALQALHAEGALDGATIRVVLTGDEESPGRPLEVVRAALRDAARNSDVALGFEFGSQVDGVDHAVVARRSFSSWRLEVEATTGHSSRIFSEDIGPGAVNEAARIIDSWYGELRGEQYLTFNVGVLLGGTEVTYDDAQAGGHGSGKINVVPQRVVATGDVRTMSDEQLERARARMRHVVEGGLPHTTAAIEFEDGYPAMFPAEGNYDLLARYDEVNQALGYGPMLAFDPGARGAADVSFVADLVDAALDGLGPLGANAHTVDESLDLSSIPAAAKRAAVLIHRLTR